MTDVGRLFVHLEQLSDALNRESDALTAEITEFEDRLIRLKLGITLWYHQQVRQATRERDGGDQDQTSTYLVFAKGIGGWGLYLRSCVVGDDPEKFFAESRLRDAAREDRVAAVKLFPGVLAAMVEAARKHVDLVSQGRLEAERLNARDVDSAKEANGMEKVTAMLKVILDIYEGGRDLIPGWKLKLHAEQRAKDGVESLWRYYEGLVRDPGVRGAWVKKTLEAHGRRTLESEHNRFATIYRGA
jgi:hypothetical protein